MNKRVIIVDFNHQAHTYFHSKFRLSARVLVDGEYVDKDTTVQSGCIKNIYRWTKGGVYPCAVCFDRPVIARKAFFQSNFPDMKVGTSGEYKGGRSKMPQEMFDAIQDCERVLKMAGVPVFAEQGYEADDLIYACVKRAKEKYPGMPIDIITNDADLLPLVDDTVSLFLRSKKGTYAEHPSLEKAKYIQVTPRNYQTVVEDLSDYRGFLIPYNSILLYKLLRGDTSDNYKRKDISRMFPPTKYNAMIERMIGEYVNFEEVFRYGDPVTKLYYKDTGESYNGTMEEALNSPDRGRLSMKICNTEELDAILELLREFTEMNDEMLSHIEKMYWGINLNQPYPNSDVRLMRRAFELNKKGRGDIGQYVENDLRKAVMPFKINLV